MKGGVIIKSFNQTLNYLVLGVAFSGLFFNFAILSMFDEYFLDNHSSYNWLILIFALTLLISGMFMSHFDGLLVMKRKTITTIVFLILIFSTGWHTSTTSSLGLGLFQILNGICITYLILNSVISITTVNQHIVEFPLYISILIILCAMGTLIINSLLSVLGAPHFIFLLLIFSYVFIGTLQLLLGESLLETRSIQKLPFALQSNLSLVYLIPFLFSFSITTLYLTDFFPPLSWDSILIMGLIILCFTLQHKSLKVLKHPFQLTTVGILISALILPLTSILVEGLLYLTVLAVLGLSLSSIYYSGMYIIADSLKIYNQFTSLGFFYCSLLGGFIGGYLVQDLMGLFPMSSVFSLSFLLTGASIFYIRQLANHQSQLKIPR
ncbi:hypothetical protein Amet_3676 [Alkaliphilus metalliredigens QYMF]|uniref:Uncharacterized protein n=1 Tax=Alkaliphilus metalliredigens (strain QYMF) TaxID=293826 RepID=A6TUC8_ALKMQ|nr:hypothetical protein [Alkaliphilus metalliredigens]ABR49796.1 hypothetical protein Amet_3676 [Alkaliphilus metalliredigens QYMF]